MSFRRTGRKPSGLSVPPPLPPNPSQFVSKDSSRFRSRRTRLSSRLDGLASILPDLSLSIYTYARKEAVLSSQIRSERSRRSQELLMFENDEAPGLPAGGVQDVSNYVAAMNHGLERLRGGFPLSLRLLCEIHGILLSEGTRQRQGARASSGAARTGSVARAQEMPFSFHRLRSSWRWTAWAVWNSFFTPTVPTCRF